MISSLARLFCSFASSVSSGVFAPCTVGINQKSDVFRECQRAGRIIHNFVRIRLHCT